MEHNPAQEAHQGRTLPQVAYEAYAVHQGWKNYQGLPIPPWRDVRPDIQDAWGDAVNAVCDVIIFPNS